MPDPTQAVKGKMRMNSGMYKCLKCGTLSHAYYRETPARGSYMTVKCIYCPAKGTSWDSDRFMNRPNYQIPGFLITPTGKE